MSDMADTEQQRQQTTRRQQQQRQPMMSSPNQRALVVLYGTILLLIVLRFNMNWFFHVPKLQALDSNNNNATITDIVAYKNQDVIVSIHPTEAFQRQANQMAHYALSHNHLNTPISQRNFVLEHGFPQEWQWRPCTLDRILQEKYQSNHKNKMVLNIVILGGTTSARAANNCTRVSSNPLEGRYSNVLQQLIRGHEAKYQRDGKTPAFSIRIQNMAHGDTNSLASALYMDTLVIPKETDVIIWDHGANDYYKDTKHNSGGRQEELRKLEFWFTRLKALYQQAKRPPPPVILLEWWSRAWWAKRPQGPTLDMHRMDYMGPNLVTKLVQQWGWEIAVLNMGAAIRWDDKYRQTENHALISDDGLHPSCTSATLAAQMLEHVLYSNWDNDNNPRCASSAQSNTTITSMMRQPIRHGNVSWSSQDQELWTDLFMENAKLGSINAWKPKQRLTTLAIGNRKEIQNWQIISSPEPQPQQPSDAADLPQQRADRRDAFVLEHCKDGDGNNNNTIVLLQPYHDLKWLGFHVQGGRAIRVVINNHRVFPRKVVSPMSPVNVWISLPDQHVPRAKKYEVAICNQASKKRAGLSYVVALSVPPLEDPS